MRIIIVGLIALLLVGCGGEEEQLKIKRDIANMQEEIYQLQQQQQEMRSDLSTKLAEISGKVEDRTSQAEIQDQLFTLRESLSRQDAMIKDLERQVSQMSRSRTSVATPAQPSNAGSDTTTEVISGSDVENQFNQSLYDFNRAKYDVAILGFSEIINNFSSSAWAEGAYYYQARAYFEQKEWRKAADSFESVRTKYSSGNFVRQAMYYQGQCYYYTNAHSKAIWTLRELIENYPGTQEAELAKSFLKKAGYDR